MRPKVLLLGRVEHATESWNSLSPLAELVEPRARNRTDFIDECRKGTLDDVLVIYRTFESVDMTGRLDEELVTALPASVKFICHNGAGYDQIDVHACSNRGVKVSNTPDAVNDSTADTAMFLILGALRRLNVPMTTLREGNWRGHPPPPLGHDPQGKTLGILGLGGIGRNLKSKAEAFGMRIIYHNRKELSEPLAGGAEYATFESLLARSDIISINIPLNADTRHMLSTREFEQMKHGVVLVNTARGAVIDEGALVEALDSGKVSSVGLDVYEAEPDIHPGLKANPNVMLLPHMGTWSVETQTAMEEKTIANVRSALEKGSLRDVVPEQACCEIQLARGKRSETGYVVPLTCC
ncbi:glyoxylate reductase [Cucurbitaria berberidis CBS 394.84]|uniref:Glyoxylate reductase n=1 Tax=Cucurbitaria berberidis CBS 394.84 TaxID=1168544 RepID=A0A9P4G9B4_9PLEO|nr:glyoxylate reductase [Cucurbitaria berberidis CBS 394.84]KAF1841074.1 glyoxylate reductase [Cucurbitaria berberidis CBS 394.84]